MMKTKTAQYPLCVIQLPSGMKPTPYRVRKVDGYINDVGEYTKARKRGRGQTNHRVKGYAVGSQGLIMDVYASRRQAEESRDVMNRLQGL